MFIVAFALSILSQPIECNQPDDYKEKKCTVCMDTKKNTSTYFVNLPCCENKNICKKCFNKASYSASIADTKNKCDNQAHMLTLIDIRKLHGPTPAVAFKQRPIKDIVKHLEDLHTFDKEILKKNTKPCPNCLIPVQKNKYRHTICHRCDHHFCGNCFKPWSYGKGHTECNVSDKTHKRSAKLFILRHKQNAISKKIQRTKPRLPYNLLRKSICDNQPIQKSKPSWTQKNTISPDVSNELTIQTHGSKKKKQNIYQHPYSPMMEEIVQNVYERHDNTHNTYTEKAHMNNNHKNQSVIDSITSYAQHFAPFVQKCGSYLASMYNTYIHDTACNIMDNIF
jgi:hypothetical protein